MGYVDKMHILSKKETFYKHTQNRDFHAYISLQILCERATMQSCEGMFDTTTKAYLSDYLKELKERSSCQEHTDLINHMFYINSMANKIKHSNAIVTFDYMQVKSSIQAYNDYIIKVLKADILYFLDEKEAFVQKVIKEEQKQVSSWDAPKKAGLSRSIHIWTGTSKNDKGFEIKGITYDVEEQYSTYATIYNFLQRSQTIKESLFLQKKVEETGKKTNFYRVYRLEMALLNLIRCGYAQEGRLLVFVKSDQLNSLEVAIEDINNYFELFKKITKCDGEYVDILIDKKGIFVQLDEKQLSTGIVIIDHTDRKKEHITDIWFSPRQNYDNESKEFPFVMGYFLKEWFGYDTFLPNQLECIQKSINKQKAICILPTGAGKSLVFYMLALLSPSPSIVISPTQVLIDDQVRNLKEFYNIDDIFYLKQGFLGETNFLNHKFIYLTPEQVQYKDIIVKLIDYNVRHKISNVFLDEIHCLCNWSHDFRPSYFVLAYNISMFMDNASCIGFTATANYKTLKDIILQLEIPIENIVKPITFDPNLYDFVFISCDTEEKIFTKLIECVDSIEISQKRDEKTIIFTQNIDETNQVWANLTYSAEMPNVSRFDEEHTYSYLDFLSQKRFLVANSDMGIGINLPQVKNVINYGYPISKSSYVQEIGRATRANTKGKNYVVFKGFEFLSDAEEELLDCNTEIDRLMETLQEASPSSIVSLLQKIVGRFERRDKMLNSMDIILDRIDYRQLKNVVPVDNESVEKMHGYLYILKNIGIVENWYLYHKNGDEQNSYFQIEFHDIISLEKAKYTTMQYLNMLSTNYRYTNAIANAKSIKEILTTYIDWFYTEYLYYHREQLLGVIEFININKKRTSKQIGNALAPYFSTNLLDIEEKKDIVEGLYVNDILNMSPLELRLKKVAAEELLIAGYNIKYDIIVLLNQLNDKEKAYSNRYLRILKQLDQNETIGFIEKTWPLVDNQNIELRLKIIDTLNSIVGFDYVKRKLYPKQKYDKAYFIFLMSLYNSAIGGKILNNNKK